MVRYVFTWNNYPDDCESVLREKYDFTYCIYGREVAPTTNTPHLQGYAECKNTISKKLLKGGSIHFKIASGTAQDSIHYIRGTGPHKGKSSIIPNTVTEWGSCATVNAMDKKDSPEGILEIQKDVADNHLSWPEFILKYPMEARDHMAFWKDVISLFSIPVEFKPRYKLSDYALAPLDLSKVNVLLGASNIGKTEFALCHFKNPLKVQNMESLRFFRPGVYDGIVLDDFPFLTSSFSEVRQLIEVECSTIIRVLYGTCTIPSGIPRIITSNVDPFKREDLKVLLPRLTYHHVTKSDLISGLPPSPTANALLKRSHATAFMPDTSVPLNKTQVIPRDAIRIYPHENAVDHVAMMNDHQFNNWPQTDEVLSNSDTEEYDDEISDSL